MAGKPKRGLDYFSFDVDIHQNTKIRRLKNKLGYPAYTVYVELLCMIYKVGQHLKFDNIDNVIFNIADETGYEEEFVYDAFHMILDLTLLDRELYEQGFLSSVGIQERYILATKRRKVRLLGVSCLLSDEEIYELDEKIVYNDGIYVNKDSISVDKDSISVDKDKQSKRKRKSESKKKKMNLDKRFFDFTQIPFEVDYFLKVFIEHSILSGHELYLKKLNDFILRCRDYHSEEVLNKAMIYTTRRIINNDWKDQDSNEITNKYSYLVSSITSNLSRVEQNIDKSEQLEDVDDVDGYVRVMFADLFKTGFLREKGI